MGLAHTQQFLYRNSFAIPVAPRDDPATTATAAFEEAADASDQN